SLLVHGLIANAVTAIGPQPEPIEGFTVNVPALVFNPDKRCPEPVHLEGIAHLVTDVRQQKSGLAEIAIFLTLVGVEGKGAHTGARYVVTGAARKDVVMQSLPGSVQVEAEFDFTPLGPCQLPSRQTEPLSIRFEFALDAAGRLIPTLLEISGPEIT